MSEPEKVESREGSEESSVEKLWRADKEALEEWAAKSKEEGGTLDKFVGIVALMGEAEREEMLAYCSRATREGFSPAEREVAMFR